MKKNIYVAPLVLGLGLSAFCGRAFAQENSLSKANQYYSSGDCQNALKYFASAEAALTSKEQLADVHFKQSYCHLNSGDNQQAANGFTNYLKTNPENEEARLRLAQAQLNLGHYQEVKEQTSKIKDNDYKSEATIYGARALIELGEYKKARQALDHIRETDEWRPVALYWKAVATDKDGDVDEAIRQFKLAKEKAVGDSWVKSDSQSWIDNLEHARRTFRGYVSLGAISDSNVYQSATGNLNGMGNGGPGGGPGGGGPGAGAGGGPGGGGPGGGPGGDGRSGPPQITGESVTGDSGTLGTAGLTYMPYYREDRNISLTGAFSAPNYKTYHDAEYETFGLTLASNFETKGHDWWGLSAQYLMSWYQYAQPYNYLIFTPYYSWNISSDWNTRFDFAYNRYQYNSQYTMTPAISTSYSVTSYLVLKLGISAVSGKGDKSVYSGTPPSVESGTAFSNYSTTGGYLGFWSSLPYDFELSGQAGSYKTIYGKEDASVPTGQKTPDDRVDSLATYSLDLGYALIKEKWLLDASAAWTKNTSSGFQSIPGATSLTTYTYNRTYYVFSTTVLF